MHGVAAPSADGTTLFLGVAAARQRSRHDVKRSHRDRAERELRTRVLLRFGATEVRHVTRLRVQHLADSLLDGTAIGGHATGVRQATAPPAPSTVRSIVGRIRQVLQYAVDDDLMTGTNPVQPCYKPNTSATSTTTAPRITTPRATKETFNEVGIGAPVARSTRYRCTLSPTDISTDSTTTTAKNTLPPPDCISER